MTKHMYATVLELEFGDIIEGKNENYMFIAKADAPGGYRIYIADPKNPHGQGRWAKEVYKGNRKFQIQRG